MMKVLNLYAGIGGNRKLWGNKHEITAVENEYDIALVYEKLFPNDKIVIDDAHQYLLDHYKEFDFIWSSPPCPTHSRMRLSLTKSEPVYPDFKLYQEIIFLKHFFKGTWVVENVTPYYKSLIEPTAIIERHYIWSNKSIGNLNISRGYKGRVVNQDKETLAAEYGFSLPKTTKNQRKMLRNAVDPRIGLHVFNNAQGEKD